VFSHPHRNLVSRALLAAQNLGFRLAGKEFRTFAHPPAAMVDVLRAGGLRPAYAHRGLAWRIVGLERAPVR
jgi:magnesium-protoporphyrin O-methyltransferase